MKIDLLLEIVRQVFGNSTTIASYGTVGGGCINQCYRVSVNGQMYFIKYNESQFLDMFRKERLGLIALASHGNIHVPEPIGSGLVDGNSYLIMEYVKSSAPSPNYWERLGQGLANLHQHTAAEFGWDSDNYIGKLPQSNRWHGNWIDFFVDERLVPQIKLARDAQLMPPEMLVGMDQICLSVNQFIHHESPSFLHGDLWSGNIMAGLRGEPWIVDPAVYYGNREIELAFTTLFGGFNERFYQAYNHINPLFEGYRERFDIYNLYPLLVHLNLFGTGYLSNIKSILDRYAR